MKLKVTPAHGSTRWLFSTTRISTELIDGSEATGTGFFFNTKDREYLVTNKHVIEDAVSIRFPLHAPTTGEPEYANLGQHKIFETKPEQWVHHPDPDIDLCCISTKEIFRDNKRDDYFFLPIHSSSILSQDEIDRLPAVISVSMIGYPNGLWDENMGYRLSELAKLLLTQLYLSMTLMKWCLIWLAFPDRQDHL